jgi:large subunit ribosomal protein L15
VKLHDLHPTPGSRKPSRRVGRGHGSGRGKTAGRGTKGQNSRGSGVRPNFEGGQMPMTQRVPKLRGFNNPFRVEYQPINLDTIAGSELDDVSPESLYARGLVSKGALVKVLGRGQLDRAVTVKAHRFSKAAEAAITAAGGSIEVLPLPFGNGRPPVKGNAHANR